MRTLTLASAMLAAFALSSAAPTQSPLSTTFVSNAGNAAGGNVYFDLDVTEPAGITITSLDINTSTQFAAPTLNVYIRTGGYTGTWNNFAAWTLAAAGVVEPAGPGNPSRVCFGTGFHVPQGFYGVSLQGAGIDHLYTYAVGIPVVYSTNEVTLTGGGATNSPFGSFLEQPRVWNGNIFYNVGQVTGACASSSTYGEGCYDRVSTWYEQFPDLMAFDMGGSPGNEVVIRASYDGAGNYTIDSAPSSWFAPLGNQLVNNFIHLGVLANNHVSVPLPLPFAFDFPGGTVSVVHATSDGSIILGATGAVLVGSLPSTTALVSEQGRICPLWCNLDALLNVTTNPDTGVYFDIDPSGQAVYVTWLDVAHVGSFGTTPGATSVNVQCALHASGDIEFRYGTIDAGNFPGAAFVGWSQGDLTGVDARDPGSVDLSTSLPLLVEGPDSVPLTHGIENPRLGTNMHMSVANAGALPLFGFVIVGDTQYLPGVDLASVGGRGCFGYTNGLASAFVTLTASGAGFYSLPIPNTPTLSGSRFYSQFAAPTLLNTLGLITSNGAGWTIGS